MAVRYDLQTFCGGIPTESRPKKDGVVQLPLPEDVQAQCGAARGMQAWGACAAPVGQWQVKHVQRKVSRKFKKSLGKTDMGVEHSNALKSS
jgi:hypothetical protein